MKKVFLIAILIIGLLNVSETLAAEIKHKIILKNAEGVMLDQTWYGVDENASYDIDDSLGEWLIPALPPFGAFFGAFLLIDSTTGDITNNLTYKDFRPIMQQEQFVMKYCLKVMRGFDNTLTLQWDALPEGIDSAKIMDVDDGFIFKEDMGKINSIDITNEYLNTFFIYVWFNKNNVSVASEAGKKEINVYPNPFRNNIIIESESNNKYYNLISITGEKVAGGVCESGRSRLDFSEIPAGAYQLVIFDNKVVYRKLLIKY
ncbi:MAG: type sorting protein [Bacteroidota bacterium]|nr:type sorting protein [Bacteroidota bacterium]